MEESKPIPENERAHVKLLIKRVKDRLESEEYKEFLKEIEKNRLYVRGKQHDDGQEGLVRANLIHAEIESMVSSAYARDPEISVTPTEAVSESRYEAVKQFGKTLSVVLNNQFAPSQGNLKARAKGSVRSALTTSFGWIKAYYQKDYGTDPLSESRIADAQDNIARLESLIRDTEDQSSGELLAKKQELEQMIVSLQAQPEVVRSEGLVLERIPSEHVIISDDVRDPDSIINADWIAHEIFMSEDRYKTRIGELPDKCTHYDPKHRKQDGDKRTAHLLRVFEIWSRVDQRIYTVLDGYEGYIREPHTPQATGERWYGFFPLYMNPVDGQVIPLAQVSLLREMQDEHNMTRTHFRSHREKSVPFNVAHGGELGTKDTAKLTNPGFMETIVLEDAPQGKPLAEVFHHVKNPPIDPAVYSTDHIRQDWELVTRRGDSARGMVAKPKTAKEAEILLGQQSVGISDQQDMVEEWLSEIAQYCAELLLQEMTLEQVKRIAGEDAQWPEMRKDDIFDLVSVSIRAGSTGKPNKDQEQQQWVRFLPELREMLLKVVEFKAAGQDDMAELMIKLLRETLQRFDERIDIDSFLPSEENDEESEIAAAEKKAQEAQQQQQQLALQMRDMLSTIANRDADTLHKIAQAEAEEAGPQIELYMGIMQSMLQPQQIQ